MHIAAEFGFTLASRSRISTPAQRDPNLFDLFGDDDSVAPRIGRD
jgi:hypothetical protein